MTDAALAFDPLFPFANLSRRQEQMVKLLWELHEQDASARMSGLEIKQRIGLSAGRNINDVIAVARVKLRRIGWDIESKLGPGGGYRIVKF